MPQFSDLPLPRSDDGLPTPLVYVHENPPWVYKVLPRDLDELPDSIELNALGADGWELTGVVNTGPQVIFYFKRLAK